MPPPRSGPLEAKHSFTTLTHGDHREAINPGASAGDEDEAPSAELAASNEFVADDVPTAARVTRPDPAALQPHAALLEGPVTDLNVISCRKRWSHTLERLSPGSMQRCEISATCMFIYCTGSHPVQVSLPSEETIECAEGESVMVDGGKNSHVIIDSPSPSLVYLARLTEQGNRHAE